MSQFRGIFGPTLLPEPIASFGGEARIKGILNLSTFVSVALELFVCQVDKLSHNMLVRTKKWLFPHLNMNFGSEHFSGCPFTQDALDSVEFLKGSNVFLEGLGTIRAAISLDHGVNTFQAIKQVLCHFWSCERTA
jgi:hypothetical protein